MSDVIEKLTKKQFDQWMHKGEQEEHAYEWQSLVAESQKPERIEAWAVVYNDGSKTIHHDNVEACDELQMYEENKGLPEGTGGRVIKLIEADENG